MSKEHEDFQDIFEKEGNLEDQKNIKDIAQSSKVK